MFKKDKIYISRTDDKDRIWLWKCSQNGDEKRFLYRLIIDKYGNLDYKQVEYERTHGWDDNILATDDEANWLEQCILNPNLNSKNIKDIPLLNKEIKYEIY
jgi:hypothetical protein